jgi:hypothetical protein
VNFTSSSDYRLTKPCAAPAHDRLTGHVAIAVPPGTIDIDTAEAVCALLGAASSGLVVAD